VKKFVITFFWMPLINKKKKKEFMYNAVMYVIIN
jgi:hypothetical protein